VLGLELAEELDCLRPFGVGNPQPTLLVPAARFEHVTAMGEEREHSRFTLVTAGGAKSRGVAFRSPPKALEPARAELHDLALRLERNRFRGVVEPRVLLRALCPTVPGHLSVLGEDEREPFWDALRAALGPPVAAPPARGAAEPIDRRGEGFAGVAGELFASGEPVLVAVADVPRRRAGLEANVAGLALGAMPVVAWGELAVRPALAAGFGHLVALDPPSGGRADPLLGAAPRAHLAWGPAEAEFALAVAGAELDLRPALAEVYRALRALPDPHGPEALEAALRGSARYPRSARVCARLVSVLTELTLIELDLPARSCRVLDAGRTDLERSAGYREARERLDGTRRALRAELPRRAPAAASAA
jgi:RecJ OB domain